MNHEERKKADEIIESELGRLGKGDDAKRKLVLIGAYFTIWGKILLRQVGLIAPIAIFYVYPPHWVMWTGVLLWLLELPDLARMIRLSRDLPTLKSLGGAGAPPLSEALQDKLQGLRDADTGAEIFERFEALTIKERKLLAPFIPAILQKLSPAEFTAASKLVISKYPTEKERTQRGYS